MAKKKAPKKTAPKGKRGGRGKGPKGGGSGRG